MKGNIVNSPRLLELRKKRRKAVIKKTVLYICGLIAISIGFVFLSRFSVFNISEIEIIGNKSIDVELVKDAVSEQITGNYLFFLPKTNIFFYPKNNIKNILLDKFKRIKSTNISLKNSKILSISLVERDGLYIWCGENLPIIETKPEDSICFFVDKDGFVFDKAPYFSGDVYFKFFGLLSDSYFSADIFQKLVTFKDNLISMGLKPIALYSKGDGNIEVYLSSKNFITNSPKILLNKNFDLEKISDNLQSALSADPLKSNLKNKYASLRYIDLRFGNKIYFKF